MGAIFEGFARKKTIQLNKNVDTPNPALITPLAMPLWSGKWLIKGKIKNKIKNKLKIKHVSLSKKSKNYI